MSRGAVTKIKQAIIRRLPRGLKTFLRNAQATTRVAALKVFSINGFLASLYFWLFSRRFYGEHHAVLKGRLQYFEDLKASRRSSPQLRRNIHRLEKGLIMRPRRPVFGEAFIMETVQAFRPCKSDGRVFARGAEMGRGCARRVLFRGYGYGRHRKGQADLSVPMADARA